jgi:hypothetical protein
LAGLHPAGQEPAAGRAVSEGRDLVLAAIGQDVERDAALKQIMQLLQRMQRRNAAESLLLLDLPCANSVRTASATSSIVTSGCGQGTW